MQPAPDLALSVRKGRGVGEMPGESGQVAWEKVLLMNLKHMCSYMYLSIFTKRKNQEIYTTT